MTVKGKILLLTLLVAIPVFAGDIQIKYLSANNIYLNKGKDAGIDSGAVLTVWRAGKEIARLEAVYVSGHSASCSVISQDTPVRLGDEIRLVDASKISEEQSSPEKKVKIAANTGRKSPEKKSATRIRGYFSLAWRQLIDDSQNGFGYISPTARLKLTAEHIGGGYFNLRLQSRSRYFKRDGQRSLTPGEEWRHRLYALQLDYDNPGWPVRFMAGRILSDLVSGAGYVDGMLLEVKLPRRWRAGIIGGFRPDNRTSEPDNNRRKIGIYLGSGQQSMGDWNGSVNVAAVGEYEQSEISREFLFLRTSLNYGPTFSLYHSMELEINRGWRKERSGDDLALSSFYVSGNYRVNDFISLRLSYDNRRNYYSYEYYTLSDSLFDFAARQGARLGLTFRPNSHLRFSLFGGARDRKETSRLTYSYGGSAGWSRIPFLYLTFTARMAGFSNLYSDGWTMETALSKSFGRIGNIRLAYGGYRYKDRYNNRTNDNPWIKLGYQTDLPLRMFMNLEGEYDLGHDLQGYQIYGELGYRF